MTVKLFSRSMMSVLIAQFFSALADNAILIAAIAIAKSYGMADQVPMLQQAFLLPFILLAPFVGQVADGFPKGRVMLLANFLKLLGAVLMMFKVNPFLAYGLIGVGAAAYSPAKYGILSQLFEEEKLVKANGMLEGSTIAAILLGVFLGGILSDHSLTLAFTVIISCYGIAALSNLLIPKLPPEKINNFFNPFKSIFDFSSTLKILFSDREARFSLLGTSVFWGSGTTLRLMLFVWVPATLFITDNQTPANLMGVVSIGIVVGALIAGIWISLERINWALVGGLILGPLIMTLAAVKTMPVALTVMLLIGIFGGLFLVPLNAMLQTRGHHTVGAGNALAVQNFSENCMMLLFVSIWSWVNSMAIKINQAILGFGSVLLITMILLGLRQIKRYP